MSKLQISTQNETLKNQMSSYSDHPLEKEAEERQTVEQLKEAIKNLTDEKVLLCQGNFIPTLFNTINCIKGYRNNSCYKQQSYKSQ